MSQLLGPTMARKLPLCFSQLCDATLQIERSRSRSTNVTLALAPGASTAVFEKPFSCLAGSPASGGKAR